MKALLMIAAALAAGCGHNRPRGGSASDAPEILSSDLRTALANKGAAMSAMRPVLALNDGTTVRTCTDYLRARRAGAAAAETTEARLAASAYVDCGALDAVRCAKRGATGAPASAGEELANRLDLRQVRTSLGPRLDDRTYTLAMLGAPLQVSETGVNLSTDDWTFALRVVALADVDADGHADWVVWMTDEAHTGTYRDYETLVVFDPDKPGPLRAVKWPKKGSADACRGALGQPHQY